MPRSRFARRPSLRAAGRAGRAGGPVQPRPGAAGLLDQLRGLADGGRRRQVTATLLTEAVDERMAKGEVLVAHLVGSGEQARVVAVERYLP